MINNNLIYDIGFHKGEDTDFYISLGYKVLAVEADPLLVDLGKEKFKKHIEDGNLKLLNYGISNKNGKDIFWVCKKNPHWNSFHKNLATKGNDEVEPIEVETITFC